MPSSSSSPQSSPSVPAVVVRPAVAGDAAPLHRLARRTIDARYRPFLGDESVDWFIGSGASDAHIDEHLGRGNIHVLEEDGEIAGLMILDGPLVDLMMVDVAHQRRGLGRTLLAAAEEILFAEYAEIRLETFTGNEAACLFYAACGWTPVGRPEAGNEGADEGAGADEAAGPERIGFVRRR